MCSKYAKDSLDRFGDDLMTQLLSNLKLEDRFRFECVSKQWRRVVYETQTEITATDLKFVEDLVWMKHTSRVFATIVTKCPNISRICLAKDCRPNDTAIDLIIKHCPHLTAIEMHLEYISRTTIDEFFARFGPQLKSLNTLGFHRLMDKKSMEKWMQMCVNIESIHTYREPLNPFADTPSITFPSVTEVRPLKRLESIHMTTIDVNALDVFADKYDHQMKTIVLNLIMWAYREESLQSCNRLMGWLSRMQVLIRLRVSLPMLSSQVLIPLMTQLGGNCLRLKSLDIDMWNWRPELVDVIGVYFKALTRVHIRVLIGSAVGEAPQTPITSEALVAFKRVTHLQLSISKNYETDEPYITDEFFANIDHYLPNVQYLDVKNVKITDQSLISLSGLRQIRGITLYGETKDWAEEVTDTGLNNLMTKCPKIVFIKFRFFD